MSVQCSLVCSVMKNYIVHCPERQRVIFSRLCTCHMNRNCNLDSLDKNSKKIWICLLNKCWPGARKRQLKKAGAIHVQLFLAAMVGLQEDFFERKSWRKKQFRCCNILTATLHPGEAQFDGKTNFVLPFPTCEQPVSLQKLIVTGTGL